MDFKDVINQRRAVNFFDPGREVPEQLVKEMIEMAAKAPSSFNLQPWSLMMQRATFATWLNLSGSRRRMRILSGRQVW